MTTDEIAARLAARTQENRCIVSEMGESVKPLLEDEEQANADITFLLAEVERLNINVHISAQTMLTDAQKDLIGYREAQDVGIVVTRICSAWNDTLAENQWLREALRPFADRYKQVRVLQSHTPSQVWYEHFAINELRAAHDALEGKG